MFKGGEKNTESCKVFTLNPITVMLNLFQHLSNFSTSLSSALGQTLKQVQGDGLVNHEKNIESQVQGGGLVNNEKNTESCKVFTLNPITVMLNLFQHLSNFTTSLSSALGQTLKQVQGDSSKVCGVNINLRQRFAFSLIELMISLIAISVITAAFTPVISKKIKAGNLTIGDSGISQVCDTKFTGCCTLCYPHKCINCSATCADCTSAQFLNEGQCKCYSCSDTANGGVANCSSCQYNVSNGSVKCKKCATTHYLDNGTCKTCPAGRLCDGTSTLKCKKGYKISGSTCVACEANTYQTTEGYQGTTCTAVSGCSAFSAADGCSSCNKGYYKNGVACSACSQGTYQTSNSSTATSCTTATGCSASTTTAGCSSCNKGYYKNGVACSACSQGTYQTSNSST
ncbi:MAG: hypothetical protein IJ877_05340, partial [Candidatus Gastranaerophilales bacterium]|nr:hypothetical protein [Candidatus Gastranaerophilales bacterium]